MQTYKMNMHMKDRLTGRFASFDADIIAIWLEQTGGTVHAFENATTVRRH